MTNRENANLAAIIKRANEIIDQEKAAAVKRGDIGASIGIASRQAQMEAYFRKRGVELPEGDL